MNFQAPVGRKSRAVEGQGGELGRLMHTTPMHGRFLCYYKNAYSNGVTSPVNEEKSVIKKKKKKRSAGSALRDLLFFFFKHTGIYAIYGRKQRLGDSGEHISRNLSHFGAFFFLNMSLFGKAFLLETIVSAFFPCRTASERLSFILSALISTTAHLQRTICTKCSRTLSKNNKS